MDVDNVTNLESSLIVRPTWKRGGRYQVQNVLINFPLPSVLSILMHFTVILDLG